MSKAKGFGSSVLACTTVLGPGAGLAAPPAAAGVVVYSSFEQDATGVAAPTTGMSGPCSVPSGTKT